MQPATHYIFGDEIMHVYLKHGAWAFKIGCQMDFHEIRNILKDAIIFRKYD